MLANLYDEELLGVVTVGGREDEPYGSATSEQPVRAPVLDKS